MISTRDYAYQRGISAHEAAAALAGAISDGRSACRMAADGPPATMI